MIFLKGQTISELYPAILDLVLREGQEVSPRGMPTLEVSPLAFELTDPRQCLVLQKARRLNYAYAIIERLALLSGRADPEMLSFYIPKLREYINPCTGCFDGAYGPRVKPQLEYVYRELSCDPASRRAVISIYSTSDQHESLDVPCTLTLNFLVRQGKLDLIVNMRSSDLFLGLPYDVSQFSFLQQVVAGWLDADVGRYVHFASSGHLYRQNFERARRVVHQADDCLEVRGDVPALSFDETRRQTNLFFELERDLRTGMLRPAELPDEPRLDSLAPDLQANLAEVVRYTRTKLASSEVERARTAPAHA